MTSLGRFHLWTDCTCRSISGPREMVKNATHGNYSFFQSFSNIIHVWLADHEQVKPHSKRIPVILAPSTKINDLFGLESNQEEGGNPPEDLKAS